MSREDKDAIRENFIGQEDGHIYFLYRPAGLEAHSISDVDSLYVVLHPFASKTLRLLKLDGSRLPYEEEHFNLVTGTVLKVDSKPQSLLNRLKEKPKVVGGIPETDKAAARPCGEGVYTFQARKNSAHLLYYLELPAEKSEVLSQTGIDKTGDYLFTVYNPYYGIDPLDPLPQVSPQYPENLLKKSDTRRIIPTDVHKFIDYEKTRFAIARETPEQGTEQILHPLKDTQKTADIFRDLRLRLYDFPVKPLFGGKWE